MKLNTIRSLIGITLFSSACLTVNAAEPTGFYVGGGLGSSYGSKFCDLAGDGEKCDDKDFAWKLLGGYQFNPMFGLEAFYTNLGNFKITPNGKDSAGIAASAEVKSEVTGFGLAATAGWPINQQVSLFGKAGFAHTNAKITTSITAKNAGNVLINETVSHDSDTNNFMAGAGVKYSFNQNLAVRVEWEFFNDIGKDDRTGYDGSDIHLFSASLVYSF